MYISAPAETQFGRFAPISLPQLNAKADMLRRRDNKYVVKREQLVALLAQLTGDFDVLEINGRRAFIYETCYFDSPTFDCFRDHHRGARKRAKVRIRNYVDSKQTFVEVKLKDKRGETLKKRLQHAGLLAQHMDARALSFVNDCFRKQYARDFPYSLHRTLDMRYSRATLVARQGGERMTIDNNLTFMNPAGHCAIDRDVFVIETKSSNGNGLADKVLRSLHCHPTKHVSKYCTGLAMLVGDLKSNRFKPAVRKLQIAPMLDDLFLQ